MSGVANDEAREELASIAASLRAYLEWQADCGSSGIPRRPRGVRGAGGPEAARAEAPPPVVVAEAAPPAPPPIVVAEATPPAPPPVVAPPGAPAADAPAKVASSVAAVQAPRPLPMLREIVASCTKCILHETRTNTVFSRGDPAAKLCFIGEAPGADEDAQGVPFVGRAGQLLDKMIQAMGLDPERDVYVCNIIKCRPPNNRRPEPSEIDACIPYLHEQVANVDPKVIVALGNTAISALLGTKLGVTRVRGTWKLYRGRVPVMPTYHPSYLLRPSPQQAEAKRQVWTDLQAVMKELGLTRPAPSP